MENLRNIISNLYIYQFQKGNDYSNISINKSNNLDKSSRDPSPIPMNNSIHNYNEIPKIKNSIPKKNNIINKNIRSYSPNYNIIPETNIIKSNINFIAKNKELLKEKEYKMREERLRKENEALNLLLSQKESQNKNYSNIQSRLYDYEQNQKIRKKNMRKKLTNQILNKKINNNEKIRSQSSEIRQKTEVDIIDEKTLKYYQNLGNSIILPKIKPETSPINNEILKNLNNNIMFLHKDYGRTPEYLEKMKEELKLKKEEEKLKEKEKKLPKGTKFLPEEEKKERLNELFILKKDFENELFSLPIARLSKKQIERKGEIEKKLDEIDDEINRLSYKEVVIKI
jgi:hypothetical protein